MKWIILPLLLFPYVSFAYDSERAKTNLASDYAVCSAYYLLMLQGNDSLRNDQSIKTVSNHCLEMAINLSNAEVVEARVKLAIKTMKDDMKNNWSNAAIVINKYGEMCKSLTENPEQRYDYWLNKEGK